MDTTAQNGGINGNLTHTTQSNQVLTPITNGAASNPQPATIGDPKTFTTTNCNAWGFAIPKTEANSPISPVVVVNNWNDTYAIQTNTQADSAANIYRFSAVQPTGQALNPIKSSTKPGNSTPDNTNLYFAACGGGSTGIPITGHYTATINLSAIANMPIDPPIITSITPNFGLLAGGTTITIHGQNFTTNPADPTNPDNALVTNVTIDSNTCTNLTIVSDTELTCVTPSGTAGLKDVVLQGPVGDYTKAQAFTYDNPTMQTFTPTWCKSLAQGQIVTLPDARDNKEYKIKKMPDNKCWMYDNLGYTGNTAAEMTAGGHTAGPGVLIETTSGSTWDTSNSTRNFVNNSTAAVTVDSGGTRCTSTETGSGTMQSVCGNQVLYNFCAANGLDSSTVPSCANANRDTEGTGMSSAGIVGAEGGKGGESKGSGGSSICPAGWRLPVGRVGSDNSKNEWAILNGSFYHNTLSAPDTNSYSGYWEPKGTDIPAGGANNLAAFGTVSSGLFYSAGGIGLYRQSITAYWWTSSLYSTGTGAYTSVTSDGVNPGANYNSNKNRGFSVRCVIDSTPANMQEVTRDYVDLLQVGEIIHVKDARDNKTYALKKMPDEKVWMLDNLAYIGGGNNTYNDVANGLIETTSGNTWDKTSTTRNYVNNSTEAVTVGSGTRCTDTETGSGTMQSVCGNRILYNFCAANGLDGSTTPTCLEVSDTTNTTGMSSIGVVGATGGKGGESKGGGGSSICPAGWRLPVGRVGASDDSKNEWAILNGSLYSNAPSAPDTGNYYGYWEPKGTVIPTGGADNLAAFGAVSAGLFDPGSGLGRQSTRAYWWSPSLYSAGGGASATIISGNVYPGTNDSNKFYGFAVRCVWP